MTLAQSTVEKEYVAAIRQAVAGGFVTRQVTRTLRDGTVEEEVTYQAPDGKLALQFLMRTRPGTWDRQGPSRTEITGAGGGPIEVNDSGIVGLAAKIDAAMRAQRALPDVDGEVVDALE